MKRILMIAEAGVNHNGSLATAKKLAQIAKECGADIVKYQTANLDSLVSKSAQAVPRTRHPLIHKGHYSNPPAG